MINVIKILMKKYNNIYNDGYLANGICRSVEVLSQAILHQGQRQQPIHQNLFYQNEQIYHQLSGAQQQRLNYDTREPYTASGSQEQIYTKFR